MIFTICMMALVVSAGVVRIVILVKDFRMRTRTYKSYIAGEK